MKSVRSARSFSGSPVAKAGNYEDYQSYDEDHTQYNKEVDLSIQDLFKLISNRWMQHILLVWMLFIKPLAIVLVVQNNFHYNQVHLKVRIILRRRAFFVSMMIVGHLAGGFARHRYDLKTHMQQQQQQQQGAVSTLASQQIPAERMGAVVGRGEASNGVVQQLVHQIQHQPHTSSSSQRASTSMSALR